MYTALAEAKVDIDPKIGTFQKGDPGPVSRPQVVPAKCPGHDHDDRQAAPGAIQHHGPPPGSSATTAKP